MLYNSVTSVRPSWDVPFEGNPMLSMRLACLVALSGMLGIGSFVVACTQKTAVAPGDDDDSDDDDDTKGDDDDTTTKKDAGSSSSSSSSSSSGGPVDSGPPPKSAMTFFISSTPAGDGGNLGGLTGADKKCQDLAAAVNGGDHKWAAFLSTKDTNAKDRIGKGPWKNQKGEVLATNLETLLDNILHPLNDGPFIDEKGAVIPDEGMYILTGSKPDGTATGNTCQDWTNNTNQQNGSFGLVFPSKNPVAGSNWASSTNNPVNGNKAQCLAAQLIKAKSQGRVACFATD